MNISLEKIDKFLIFKISLVVIVVALVTLIGIKIGELVGRFIYYILH